MQLDTKAEICGRHSGEAVFTAGQFRQRRNVQEVKHFAEGEGQHGEINAGTTQRQGTDDTSENRGEQRARDQCHQSVVYKAVGQEIRGSEPADAVERRLSKGQKAGEAEEDIETETEQTPDQDAVHHIVRAAHKRKHEREEDETDKSRKLRQPGRSPAVTGRGEHLFAPLDAE